MLEATFKSTSEILIETEEAANRGRVIQGPQPNPAHERARALFRDQLQCRLCRLLKTALAAVHVIRQCVCYEDIERRGQSCSTRASERAGEHIRIGVGRRSDQRTNPGEDGTGGYGSAQGPGSAAVLQAGMGRCQGGKALLRRRVWAGAKEGKRRRRSCAMTRSVQSTHQQDKQRWNC